MAIWLLVTFTTELEIAPQIREFGGAICLMQVIDRFSDLFDDQLSGEFPDQ